MTAKVSLCCSAVGFILALLEQVILLAVGQNLHLDKQYILKMQVEDKFRIIYYLKSAPLRSSPPVLQW